MAKRNNVLLIIGGIVLACTSATVGAIAMRYFMEKVQAEMGSFDSASRMVPEPVESASRPKVEVVRPKVGGLARKTSQSGVAHAFESAELFAKVSGYLSQISVDIGTMVQEGDVLAELSIPELNQDVDSALASLKQAKAEIVQAEANVESMIAEQKALQAKVTQAKADIDRFKSESVLASKQLARFRELNELKAIEDRIVDEHKQQYESSCASVRAAESTVNSAEQQASAALSKITLARAELSVYRAKAQVAESQVKRAQVMQSYTKIVSPYAGVVTARNFHRGAFVRSPDQGGQIPLLSVDRIDKMRVVVKIPERDVPYVQVGDMADIHFDAFPRRDFRAPVARIAATEVATSRTMIVEMDLQNVDGLIRAQMYGRVEIALEDAPAGLTIPSSCLIGEVSNGKAKLFAVSNQKLVLRDIVVGIDTGVVVEVLQGIGADELVVNRPAVGLSEGTEVATMTVETSKAH